MCLFKNVDLVQVVTQMYQQVNFGYIFEDTAENKVMDEIAKIYAL